MTEQKEANSLGPRGHRSPAESTTLIWLFKTKGIYSWLISSYVSLFLWVLSPLTCESFKSRSTWSLSSTLTLDVIWCLSLRGLSNKCLLNYDKIEGIRGL